MIHEGGYDKGDIISGQNIKGDAIRGKAIWQNGKIDGDGEIKVYADNGYCYVNAASAINESRSSAATPSSVKQSVKLRFVFVDGTDYTVTGALSVVVPPRFDSLITYSKVYNRGELFESVKTDYKIKPEHVVAVVINYKGQSMKVRVNPDHADKVVFEENIRLRKKPTKTHSSGKPKVRKKHDRNGICGKTEGLNYTVDAGDCSIHAI